MTIRSSYDRSLSVGLVAGTRVFCCDNLAFSGEAKASRKHTANVFRDLPDLIYRMLSQVASMRERIDQEITDYKRCGLHRERAHHLIVEAIRCHVVPASWLPKVLAAWENPQHLQFKLQTAWSLFNAITEVQHALSPRAQMEGSLRLHQLFRREFQIV